MKAFHRPTLGPIGLAVAVAGLAGMASPAAARSYDDDGFRSGMVFTSTNALAGNELVVFARGKDGTLSLHARFATGGLGSGTDQGSQGAVTLSGDGRFVFVVNAQSDTVSTFALLERDIRLTSVVPSGGLHPISVSERRGIVYVLNDNGAGNVTGLRNVQGELQPIAGSVRGLSVAGGSAPAQVGLSTDGDTLVVAEKNTNHITSYRVRTDGSIDPPVVTVSPGLTPFGFAFDRSNNLLVSEAAAGAPGASTTTSYRFSQANPAQPVVVSPSGPDFEAGACWVAITPDSRYAYVTNAFSGSVSSYGIEPSGRITLINARAGLTGEGTAPGDDAVSKGGRQLYVLHLGTGKVSSFGIEYDGSLTPVSLVTGLPGTAMGMAAN